MYNISYLSVFYNGAVYFHTLRPPVQEKETVPAANPNKKNAAPATDAAVGRWTN
jgi:hypothetical protein